MRHLSIALLLILMTACGQGPQGLQGDPGSQGLQGIPGAPGMIDYVALCAVHGTQYFGVCSSGNLYVTYTDGLYRVLPLGYHNINGCSFVLGTNCSITP